jgi:hypothetical protein
MTVSERVGKKLVNADLEYNFGSKNVESEILIEHLESKFDFESSIPENSISIQEISISN